MGAIRTRLARHPRLTVAGIVLATAVLAWAGYEAVVSYNARSYRQRAEQALDRRDWRAARDSLKDAIRLRPDDPEAHRLAARAERRLENLDAAKKYLDASQDLHGGETQGIKVERALLRVHSGELAAVESFLRDCLRQDDPDTTEILDILSAALELNYREAEAQRCLDDLLRRQPTHFDALVRRGRTARNMGWYQDAIEHYQRALDVRPSVDTVRLALAELQVGHGQFAQAREHLDRLLAGDPRNPAVRFGLARCAVGLGDGDKARALFDQLLVENPDSWMVLYERGKLAVQRDRLTDAVADLKAADALAPPDVAPTDLVNGLLALNKPDEARPYQEKVNRILADRKRAAELGDLIREKAPDDPDLRCEMGQVLLRLGKQKDAVHWLRTAIEKAPRHRKSHETLATFFQSVNAVDLAEYHRRFLQRP